MNFTSRNKPGPAGIFDLSGTGCRPVPWNEEFKVTIRALITLKRVL
jgi:hypothetical protein